MTKSKIVLSIAKPKVDKNEHIDLVKNKGLINNPITKSKENLTSKYTSIKSTIKYST